MTQDTSAAERSAHVTRGPATRDAPGILVEVAPGQWQLRAVRDAYRAGISAAAVELRRQAREIRRSVAHDPDIEAASTSHAISNAAALEQAADSLAELPAAYEPTGLEYRGG